MKNLLLTLRFNGARYHGFQVQKNAVSVCQVFQDGVERIFGSRLDVKGCSRTDTGVHALMYCLSMRCEWNKPCERLVLALNRHLPDDIAVMDCREVPMDFHARYSCTGKEYIYKILNSHIKDPFSPNLIYRYDYTLDAAFLREQAQDFVGRHDFASMCSAGSDIQDTRRAITRFEVERQGDVVCFRVAGDGFLYNMVRIMVGTLVYIGSGRLAAGSIPDILAARNRGRAGKTMPACGLYLSRVYYGDGVASGNGN